MKAKIFILFLVLSNALITIQSQVPKRPFPQNTSYFKGSIIPNSVSKEALNNFTIKFYPTWKNAYLRHDCANPKHYYIYTNEFEKLGEKRTICVSEGQGYGMQIIVLMAGIEKDAQEIYDGLYLFARAHPSSTSKYLMSWNIRNGCISNIINNKNNSATDGDMDIAISLLMADSQWGSNGAINYKEEARKTINAILKFEINTKKHTALLSDANLPTDFDYNDIRTSDYMPAYLKVFNMYFPNPEWPKVIDNTYSIFKKIQQTYSPKAGFFPDFICLRKGKYIPAKPHYLEGPFDGNYYYNACRDPFRIGLDYLIFGEPRAREMLDHLNDWIQAKSKYNADDICSGYYLNGENFPNHHDANPAFVCPFAIGAMVNSINQEWLNDCWNTIYNFEFKDFQYYNNTLQMITSIVISGNYWLPKQP